LGYFIALFPNCYFEDKLKSAEFILGELQNSYSKAYLLFLKYVLNSFNSFNALFQSKSILLHKLSSASVQLMKEFCSNFIKVDCLNQTHISKINVKNPNNFLSVKNVFLGHDCENFIKDLPRSTIEQIKSTYLSFYCTTALEIKSRLPIDNPLYTELQFIDHTKILDSNNDWNDFEFKILSDKYKDLLQYNNLEIEWRKLRVSLTETVKTKLLSYKIDEFWHYISNLKDFKDETMFPNLSKLAQIFLTLPHSNAEAERIFSIVTDVKTKKRNRLGNDSLNSIFLQKILTVPTSK